MIYTVSGVFRCGPASVKAVKQGEVYLPYDTSFVFAEVNGDRVFWEVEENGPMKPIRVDKKCIGKLISTKAVGSDDREDITHEYKHPEGILTFSKETLFIVTVCVPTVAAQGQWKLDPPLNIRSSDH